MCKSKKILVIAGEESGDLHGSNLIKELMLLDNELEIMGIGGDKMIKNGMNALYHINQMSFLGFIEVIKHLPFIKEVKRELISKVRDENIKLSVLIDYPGFNLSISKSFRKMGLKNIYYISPQIWAWGKGRIKKIKNLIDKMIVFFPFEEKLYKSYGVNAEFVGHPLVKSISEFDFISKEDLYHKYNLDLAKKYLLILPGSRKQELNKILEPVLEASQRIAEEHNLQTVIACADNINELYFDQFKGKYKFKLIKSDTYNLLKNAKFAIVKSGTSTLETGIIGTPFIVVYKTNYFTYLIGKMLIKIKNISLANIVAEENIVKELIQNEVTSDKIYSESHLILRDNNKYNKLKMELEKIQDKLKTEGNPSKKAAKIIYNELNAA